MDLYPAIDIRGGCSVRLVRGDYSQETVYGDPLTTAMEMAAAGAHWLHLVDLDAARTGEPINRAIATAISTIVPVQLQVGGGVRDEATAEVLLGAGVARVVLGTAAVEQPELVATLARRHPGRVAVGLDHRHGQVAVRGWLEGSGQPLAEALGRAEAAGVAAVVVTDIARDGTLGGPDLDGLTSVLAATTMSVIGSGGVGCVADLVALTELEAGGHRLAGAIVGKAIHDGRIGMAEALAACAASG